MMRLVSTMVKRYRVVAVLTAGVVKVVHALYLLILLRGYLRKKWYMEGRSLYLLI
jgi:hypothetical protein